VAEAPFRIRVHDTLSGQLTSVEPASERGKQVLRIYVCGVTPYDSGHMGHAFTFCTFDTLVRFAEAGGVRVRYVQNVTDVDDPLFERARRDRVDWMVLAERETRVHVRDMTALGWRPPDFMPRVSSEIPTILDAISRLHARGYAYQTDALYFDVSRYKSYGDLSHRTRRSMIRKLHDEGLLGHVGPDGKRDELDFALWRPSAPDEPAWPSPYGSGRPGWHIECSAMAMRYLGNQIDIHGGGRDLAFSHHESERAQSESLMGGMPLAKAWMHAGMVRYAGKKMSKSLGNLVLVNQALERAPAAAIRLYLASHHYRSDWTFSWAGLARTVSLVERLRVLIGTANVASAPVSTTPRGARVAEFQAALAADLDTPLAIEAMRAAATDRDANAVRFMLGILAGTASLT
jgi:L-cysteine:1D-myo-inositol 2-amino-2-deoxy-alpha-D-glucopyranoside ligase